MIRGKFLPTEHRKHRRIQGKMDCGGLMGEDNRAKITAEGKRKMQVLSGYTGRREDDPAEQIAGR